MFLSHQDRVIQKPKKMIADATATYGCEICDELYYSETEVEVHKQTGHSKDMPIPNDGTCLVCYKQFQNRSQLISHIKTVHLLSSRDAIRVEQNIYICDLCTKIFFVKELMELHILTRHKNFYSFERKPCPMCRKPVLLSSMWYHKEQHCPKSVAICPICLKKQTNTLELTKHMDDHRKYLKCEMCCFETRKTDIFRWHILNSHKLVDKTGKIDELTAKTFFVPTQKPTHWRFMVQFVANGLNLHNMLHICVLCREICENTPQMVSHVLEHMQEVKSKVKVKLCSCGQHFTTDILLKHHVFKLKGHHKVVSDESEVIRDESEGIFDESEGIRHKSEVIRDENEGILDESEGISHESEGIRDESDKSAVESNKKDFVEITYEPEEEATDESEMDYLVVETDGEKYMVTMADD